MKIKYIKMNYKNIEMARDFIDGVSYECVKNVVYSADNIVYDNYIINNFMNFCRSLDVYDLTEKHLKKIKDTWVFVLNSILEEK